MFSGKRLLIGRIVTKNKRCHSFYVENRYGQWARLLVIYGLDKVDLEFTGIKIMSRAFAMIRRIRRAKVDYWLMRWVLARLSALYV